MTEVEQAQHTPGPWVVVVGLEGVAIVGDGVHICDVDDQCDEDDANACLIAAAPELLSFVQSFDSSDNWYELVDAAKTLIAKATGGQS